MRAAIRSVRQAGRPTWWWPPYGSTYEFAPNNEEGAEQLARGCLESRSHDHTPRAPVSGRSAGGCAGEGVLLGLPLYNVITLERARRRGLGTALTAVHLHDALARGCQTASLQSTEMAERVYAAVGFRDLGRILEYVAGGPRV